ncbi:GGDEF domain-containing protein [Uliginosibacterium sp. TH139]|uniref:GGDEF domain-containing protein n=1 Tax=Uliginosibacterium sp. TH139 TaxID=2067453 RepID=UPI000C7D8DDC|nr:GGDEF domain-containing protein [Uliginosibacterium sp. TH139]PLK50294.1 GGDEF domain-containing protein [Uliginosibacterium sp. TH139]
MPARQPASDLDEDRLLQTLHEEQRRIGLRLGPVSIVLNVGFALLFAILQIWPLAASYLAGSLYYLWVFRATNAPGYRPNRLVLWIWLVIFAQALLAVLLLGPGAGFQLYLVGTLLPSFSSLSRPLSHKLFQGAVIVAFFLLCDTWLASETPLYALTPRLTAILRHFNILGFCAILAWIAHAHALSVHEAEQALHRIASSDPLTGLFNRRAITELAEREIARSQRTHQPLSLILCDIDHFKRINDSHGHAAGDHVLQTVAKLLQATVREYDCVARWGGEEFLILLPDATGAGAAAIAERLRAAVEACVISFEGQAIPVTLTLGVSLLDPQENWHAAINRADEALYRGKAGGRNRVETGV